MTDLRVTVRALREDFDLDEASTEWNSEQLSDTHPLLKAFFERRSVLPIGTETTHLPVSSQVVYNLHAGRYRGITWHDSDDDVVWLLGCGWHESGSINDVYQHLKNADIMDRLLPTAGDYRHLYVMRENTGVADLSGLVKEAQAVGPKLREEAESNPGTTCSVNLGEIIQVSEIVEEHIDGDFVLREYELRFQMPPTKPGILPSDNTWGATLVPAFLPYDSDVSDWSWSFNDSALVITYEDIRPRG